MQGASSPFFLPIFIVLYYSIFMNDWLTDIFNFPDTERGGYPARKAVCSVCKAKAASGDQIFQFQGSTDTGGSYGVTVTTTILIASHDEGNGTSSLAYEAGHDIAQSTGFQRLCKPSNTAADNNAAGYLHLFNPSGTVGVKHFLADTNSTNDDTYSNREIVGGYFNTTSAIDAIQFKMASGDIDAGDICLFGIN